MRIAVSAVALVEAGPLTILLQAVDAASSLPDHQFYFLVKDPANLPKASNINYIPFPKANTSYLRRIYTEYVKFKKISKVIKPDIWLSLGDTTPIVEAGLQAVYCHNPLPFLKNPLQYLFREPNIAFRGLFYKQLYKYRINKNRFLIGQQEWFGYQLAKKLGFPEQSVLTVTPKISELSIPETTHTIPERNQIFAFYPALPRAFKNFEEAITIATRANVTLGLTLSGDENRYATALKTKFSASHIHWLGRLPYALSLGQLSSCEVLLFPSQLETYGLPIAEAIHFQKPVLIPINPWTHSIAKDYPLARFYDSVDEAVTYVNELKEHGTFITPNSKKNLCKLARLNTPENPYSKLLGFRALFDKLINERTLS